MTLPPPWKVKREAVRIWFQIENYYLPIVERFSQLRYDSQFKKLTKLIDGRQKISKKIVILFIYQPIGLAKSILVTCEFLHDQGYAVLLVSSTPVDEHDLQILQQRTWKILLRPNYGYDFGGYRDGVRVLKELGIEPDMLLIMNDSAWIPLTDDSQMIKKMEDDSLFLTGPVFENVVKRDKHKEYFQSYLMLIKSKALKSSGFINYWRDYRISSRKRIVLVRGEEGFSEALFNDGFGGGAPSTRTVLFDLIQKQSNVFLLKTIEYATYLDVENLLAARNLVREYSDTGEWRTNALLHLNTMPKSTQPMGVIPYACIKLLGFSFLKKSSFPPEHDGMRWQFLRAVKNGDLPAPHPDILAEIMASKMDPSLTTDPSIPTPVSATKVP